MMFGMAMLSACSDSMSDSPDASQRMVDLHLMVSLNNPGADAVARSSSYPIGQQPDGYPFGFEDAATVYEGINTLRVIVVNVGNVVEGNKCYGYPDRVPQPGDLFGEYIFRVIGGETKRIYVIANEASIHPAVDWEGSYAKGATLTPAAAADLQMASQWTSTHEASPYIDNTGSTRSYIPMSEYFDIPIADASSYGDGQQPIQSETLFVTRSTVKFAFYIDSDNTISTESFRFAEIAISGLAEKQYLFPCNTTYSPAKYPLNVNSDGRVITTYTTPPSLTTAPYVFTPVDFGYNAGGASSSTYTKAYAPQLYFLESPVPTGGDGYQLTAKVEIDNNPEPVEFGPVALPNLPSLPRNTFVKVYFSFTGYTINCEVKVVPYVEIALDPDYGSFGPRQDSPIISWPSGNN